MKIELGCGHSKSEGFIGVDLVPEADIQKDMYEYLITLSDNSVDVIRAFHSLEHLAKDEFIKVMNQVLRVCKNGSSIEIGVPYHTQYVNIANPYHKTNFNEHTFRFFCREKDDRNNVLKKSNWIRDYSFGLWGSANEGKLPGYVRIKKIDYVYLPKYANKSEDEREEARLHLNNVVLEMNIELEVEK
jgi:ubiquinone/menaquinone biosynthesis C-methylase UbiE